MSIKTTIQRILGKIKDVGSSILRKGTIQDSSVNREAIKQFTELKKSGVSKDTLEEIRKRIIGKLKRY